VKLRGFAERLAYARLLVHLRTGRCVTHTEISEAVGRTQPWVTKWARSATPPRDYEVHRPLAAFLDVDEAWLVRGEGSAPEPELWERWLAAPPPRPAPRPPASLPAAAETTRHGEGRKRGTK